METIKKKYQVPEMNVISLDNEITLVLLSNPPQGPGEGSDMNLPEYYDTDPISE